MQSAPVCPAALRRRRRSLNSNRLLVTVIANRETRVARNARLPPTAVTTKDVVTGITRTTATHYCEQADVDAGICPRPGLVLSVDGPRSDVNDVVTYSYHATDYRDCATAPASCASRKGHLWKTSNALGHVTEVLAYDGAGRVLSVMDANGVVADLSYHPRGWLTERKLRGADAITETDDAITGIAYWPTGLVQSVTQPDGSITTYTYDAAQRLTGIADNAGNTITYTLDKARNRIAEQTRDAWGTLKHSLSRVYDQLGQLATQADAFANPRRSVACWISRF